MTSAYKLLVPEVIQSSAMDCGPAALKAILDGFHIPVSYGRLREACQTSVDGTSIDVLEAVACQLGLDAEQVMVPLDHLWIPEAQTLPCILVTQLPIGLTHFVVVWRRVGNWLQIMNPAEGRKWVRIERFMPNVYEHQFPVPSAGWLEWASSEEFLNVLRVQLATLKVGTDTIQKVIRDAFNTQQWRDLAILDAATRMATQLAQTVHLDSTATENLLHTLITQQQTTEDFAVIPKPYWSVTPYDEEHVILHGAVLVRIKGQATTPTETETLSPELVAALAEKNVNPMRELASIFSNLERRQALFAMLVLFFTSLGLVLEAVLFRSLLDITDRLLPAQKYPAMVMFLGFIALLMVGDWLAHQFYYYLSRHLEVRLRLRFLEKIPRLNEQYFRSRLISDMAERSHSLEHIRLFPYVMLQMFARSILIILLTTIGIIWLSPANAPLVIFTALMVILLPMLALQGLSERELRAKSHTGALSHFYLDSLLGLIPIKTHGAERNVRRAYDEKLGEWRRAKLQANGYMVIATALQSVVIYLLVALLMRSYIQQTHTQGIILLLVYWTLDFPRLGRNISLFIQIYTDEKVAVLRLLEPLLAPSEILSTTPTPLEHTGIHMEHVTVQSGGHLILEDIGVDIPHGTHVAILGHSGAGKSSFVGLLLGSHRAVEGVVKVGGEPLDIDRLRWLHEHTAWVDPNIQLWNRSLLSNLRYGNPQQIPIASIIEHANLQTLLENLPHGYQSFLGESGALVSGGEGQRVRLGRAMLRPNARLVILDEPFRGLEHRQRRELLHKARQFWKDATLLCITHDIAETQDFGRVLIFEQGRLVEDGNPQTLAQQPASHYRRLLDHEKATYASVWESTTWRQLVIENQQLHEKER